MREVSLVISELGPGGAQRVVTWLANRSAALGRRVDLVTLDDGTIAPHYDLDPAVRRRALGVQGRSRGPLGASVANLARIAALRRALDRGTVAPVVSFVDATNVLACLAAHAAGRPVVVSERTDLRAHDPGRAWARLRPIAYRLAARIVVQTEAVRGLLPVALRSRTVVIPNAVAAPPPSEGPRDPNRIVGLGRLSREKGFDRLLEAFARIRGEHPAARLVIWGEGPERAALEALRDRLGLAAAVDLPGITRDPATCLAEAAVFALPSRFEGFPNALAEAMASGCAVAAFDCRSGPRDLVRDDEEGVLVPDGDVESMAAALDRLLRDDVLRDRMGRAARRSTARFAPAVVGAAWDRLLDDVAAGARR